MPTTKSCRIKVCSLARKPVEVQRVLLSHTCQQQSVLLGQGVVYPKQIECKKNGGRWASKLQYRAALHIGAGKRHGGTLPPFEIFRSTFDGANIDIVQGFVVSGCGTRGGPHCASH